MPHFYLEYIFLLIGEKWRTSSLIPTNNKAHSLSTQWCFIAQIFSNKPPLNALNKTQAYTHAHNSNVQSSSFHMHCGRVLMFNCTLWLRAEKDSVSGQVHPLKTAVLFRCRKYCQWGSWCCECQIFRQVEFCCWQNKT